jgi:hypothetical protein
MYDGKYLKTWRSQVMYVDFATNRITLFEDNVQVKEEDDNTMQVLTCSCKGLFSRIIHHSDV